MLILRSEISAKQKMEKFERIKEKLTVLSMLMFKLKQLPLIDVLVV